MKRFRMELKYWLEDVTDWMYDHSQALMSIGVPLVEIIVALIILKFTIF